MCFIHSKIFPGVFFHTTNPKPSGPGALVAEAVFLEMTLVISLCWTVQSSDHTKSSQSVTGSDRLFLGNNESRRSDRISGSSNSVILGEAAFNFLITNR